MEGAWGDGMDGTVFGMKRAHLVVQHRLVKKMLRRTGLTPARFDMLFVLFEQWWGIEQKQLRKCLGVARSTVSRMLGALDGLGLVSRGMKRNGSSRYVTITELGKSVLKRAMMRRALVRQALNRTMDFGRRDALDHAFNAMRAEWHDSAMNMYPWHPDE